VFTRIVIHIYLLFSCIAVKPGSREGSRDRGPSVPQKPVPSKDVTDKNKRNNLPSGHKDKVSGPELRDRNNKIDNGSVPLPSGGSLSSIASQKPSAAGHISKSMSTSALPGHLEPIKPLNVPKPRSPTPPEDPTLPTRYLDITQFKAPEDLEGDDEHHAGPVANPNPDMNHLTHMLQQGMSIAEVAKSMNIKLDEQTNELLTTLKQQLDLATALAKQSAVNQGPGSVPSEQGEVGKTYDYSNVNYAANENSSGTNNMNPASSDNSGVQMVLNQMLTKQQGSVIDYRTQDPAYSQARDSGDGYYNNSRDPYSQVDNRPLDTSGGDLSDTSLTDKSLGAEGYSLYRGDSQTRSDIQAPVTYGEYNRDSNISSGVNSDIHSTGYNRYSNSDSRSGSVQKQYSYGSDYSENEGAQITSHRNSSSSSYTAGGAATGPASLLGSPPFRNTGESQSGSSSLSNPGFGRQLSDEGKFTRGHGPYGNTPQSYKGGQQFNRSAPRPLMSFDTGRGRGGRGGYREKW
jgi:hypothetical protein